MAHLAGIDKGPVLDWTNDNGLMECFRMWKKEVEILFQGPLTGANDAVKCNYIIYWSGDTGRELVDKWEMAKLQMPAETKYDDTLTYLKNTSHPNQML